MDLEILKQNFHNLIDQIENEKLLDHFYQIIYNLQISREKQKILMEEIEQFDNLENFN